MTQACRSQSRKSFYKYMSADVAKIVLQNSSLRWSSPALFNDPFDVQFDLRVEYDRGKVIDRVLQNLIDLYMGRRHVIEGNVLATGIKLLQRTAPGLKEVDLRAMFREKLSDGMDAAEKNLPKSYEEMRAVLAPLKLLCLSEVPDSILMWAHYAKNYTGVVVELSVLEKYDSAWGAAKPVRYEKEMPFLVDDEKLVRVLSGEGTIATAELFEQAVYVKAADWAYEKEWRLIGGWEKDKTAEYVSFKPEEVSAVYFGCRIDDAVQREIEKVLIAKYSHASVYRSAKSPKKFALDFLEI